MAFSAVKGAFGSVSMERLTAKLQQTGLHADIVGFLSSWLADRTSKVVVGGFTSCAEPLTDSVFQGTVLGPPLWNTFFADSTRPLTKKGFASTAFADDLNAWKAYRLDKASATPLEHPLVELREVQSYTNGALRTRSFLNLRRNRSIFYTALSTRVTTSKSYAASSTPNCAC